MKIGTRAPQGQPTMPAHPCLWGAIKCMGPPLQILLQRAAQDYPKDSPPPLRFIRSCSSSLAAPTLHKLEAAFKVPVLEVRRHAGDSMSLVDTLPGRASPCHAIRCARALLPAAYVCGPLAARFLDAHFLSPAGTCLRKGVIRPPK